MASCKHCIYTFPFGKEMSVHKPNIDSSPCKKPIEKQTIFVTMIPIVLPSQTWGPNINESYRSNIGPLPGQLVSTPGSQLYECTMVVQNLTCLCFSPDSPEASGPRHHVVAVLHVGQIPATFRKQLGAAVGTRVDVYPGGTYGCQQYKAVTKG